MVGNDVVDLQDVDARPETFRRRFDLRVFSADERRAIAADPDPHARRWAHWAAKEAAYKLGRQHDASLVFSPGRLDVRFEPVKGGVEAGAGVRERHGRVELVLPGTTAADPCRAAMALELRSFETADYVHVVARPAGEDWSVVVLAVEALAASGSEPNASDASAAVRALALREITRRLGVDGARLAIGRRGRIPTVELDGEATPLALSLSHHGRFVAMAVAIESTPRLGRRGLAPQGGAGSGSRGVARGVGAVGRSTGLADIAWMAG